MELLGESPVFEGFWTAYQTQRRLECFTQWSQAGDDAPGTCGAGAAGFAGAVAAGVSVVVAALFGDAFVFEAGAAFPTFPAVPS